MLVLLDIDGTLCDTFDVDGDCYVESLSRTFGFTNISTDWNSYPEATDSGILRHIFDSKLDRSPTNHETKQMVDCFHTLLQDAFTRDPHRCKPIDGGPLFISSLRSNDVPFAIATGGWQKTAALKLRAAGYHDLDVPMSTADTAISRRDICTQAVDAASRLHGKSLTPVIYIGDGLWDRRAANQLGYHFVGRSTDKTKFDHGCAFVIEDFCDPNLLDRLNKLQMDA